MYIVAQRILQIAHGALDIATQRLNNFVVLSEFKGGSKMRNGDLQACNESAAIIISPIISKRFIRPFHTVNVIEALHSAPVG